MQTMQRLSLTICLVLLTFTARGAVETPDAALLASWVAMDAPTGHEHHGTRALQRSLTGWSSDRTGNLSKMVGDGPGLTIAACLLDAPAFTVSRIRPDGYLRLHHIGRPPNHPLWSQAHEGQQLRILTRDGPVVGVTALANGHFMNLHRHEKQITRADDLWLDVGATSEQDVESMGIRLLDPAIRHLPGWHFEQWVAGPAAGARTGCATIVAAAEAGLSGSGRTRYVLATQSSFRNVGLGAAIAGAGDIDGVILLGRGVEAAGRTEEAGALLRAGSPPFDSALLTLIEPEVVDAGALMERVHSDQAVILAEELAAALGASPRGLHWIPAPAPEQPLNSRPDWAGRDGERAVITEFADRLKSLGEMYGVSGHETPVRQAILDALPAWARVLAETDEMGNLWLEVGPGDREATVFMAHMDEVGWKVTAIHDDGTVDLKRQGGALALAREGQPALLQLSAGQGRDAPSNPAMLRGLFLNRPSPEERWPSQVSAWFGLDGGELEDRGVIIGMPVTGYKEAHRLAAHRFTVRGMDDRVGSAALLAVVQGLDPDELHNRVIFAWSVQEEGGLHGARSLAQRFALETRRIYSIDTFVTSDMPLESAHFAYAPLGEGPVLRSMESSGLVRPEELDRNLAVARKADLKVQVGITQGGTDGTTFTFFGAPNAGLSWPGRYSHGPAELGDLRDMVSLVKLVDAFVRAEP